MRQLQPEDSFRVVLHVSRSWFSLSRSIETMLRGKSNKPVVLSFTRRIPAIEAVSKAGMLGSFTDLHPACFSDGVASVKGGSSISAYLHGARDIQCEENAL